jgi:hypothetical protein
MTIDRADLVSLAISLGASAFIAYGDLHTDDTGVVAGLIAVTSFAAAMIQPQSAWRWALLIGAGVPLAELWARGIHRDTFLIASATMAFALAGSYLAVIIRRGIEAVAR